MTPRQYLHHTVTYRPDGQPSLTLADGIAKLPPVDGFDVIQFGLILPHPLGGTIRSDMVISPESEILVQFHLADWHEPGDD